MSVIGDLLFWSGRGADLDTHLRHVLQNVVAAEVDRVPASDFSSKSDDEIVAALVEKLKGEPIELKREEAEPDVVEKSVYVQDVFGGTATVPGLRIAKIVPFAGEAGLFKLTPNQWDTNPPHGEVRGNNLIVGMEVRASDDEQAIQYIDQTLAKVQIYIDRQKAQLDAYNGQLPDVIRPTVERRRATLGKASSVADRLRGR
jgi:uncharacterized coiled-coil protein SlyX